MCIITPDLERYLVMLTVESAPTKMHLKKALLSAAAMDGTTTRGTAIQDFVTNWRQLIRQYNEEEPNLAPMDIEHTMDEGIRRLRIKASYGTLFTLSLLRIRGEVSFEGLL